MSSTVVEILARLRVENSGFLRGLRDGAKEVKDLGGHFQDAAGRWRSANGQFTTAAERMSRNLRNAGESTANLERAIRRESDAADRAAGANNRNADSHRRMGLGTIALGGIMANAATGGAMMLGSGLMRLATSGLQATMSMEQSKIAFTTMMGSAQKAGAFLGELRELAANTPFELSDLVQGSRRLMAMGFSAGKAKEMLIAVGDASSGLGIGAEGISRITLALGQMKAKGKIAGDEMLQMSEAGIPALQYLADGFGVTTAEMQKMISKGLVPADKGIDMIVKGMQKGTANAKGFGGMMQAQSQTLSGVFSTLKDEISMAMVDALTPFIPQMTKLIKAVTPLAGSLVKIFAKAMGGLITLAFALGSALAPLVGVFKSVFGYIANAVSGPLEAATNAFKLFIGVFTGNNALVAFGASLDSGVVQKIAKFASGLRTAFDQAKNVVTTFVGIMTGNNGLAGAGATLQSGTLAKVIAFANGVKSTFGSIKTFITQGVMPIWAAIGRAVLGLAPQAQKLGAAFKANILPALGAVVGLFRDHLMPALTKVGQAIATYLVPAFAKVTGAVMGLITAVMPEIKKFIDQAVKVLGPAFDDIGNILSTKVLPILGEVVGFIAKIIGWLTPVVKWLLGVFLGALIGALKGIVNIVKGVLNVIVGIFDLFIGLFTGDWSRAWEGVKEIFLGLWQVILGAVQVFLNIGILKAFRTGFAILKGIVRGAAQIIKGIFEGSWNGIKALTTNFWGIVKGLFSKGWSTLKSLVSGGAGAIRNTIVGYLNLYKAAFRFAWETIKAVVRGAWTNLIEGTRTKVTSLMGIVRGLPGRIRGALGDLGGLLRDAGRRLINGLISGITDKIAALRSKLGAVTNMIPDWKGPKSKDERLLRPTGRIIMGGLSQGFMDGAKGIQRTLGRLTSRTIPQTAIGDVGRIPTPRGGGSNGPIQLEIISSGNPVDDFIVELLRRSVRVKGGGDVQIYLGVNK